MMTWTLVALYAALAAFTYLAMVARTPTRRLFGAIGILAAQLAAFMCIQIIARALGSQSNPASFSVGAGALYLAVRPLLFFNLVGCIALVLIVLAALCSSQCRYRTVDRCGESREERRR